MNERMENFAETVRRWLAKLLSSHGGGFYAFGYAVCFVYLEVLDLAEDIVTLLGGDTNPIAFVIEFFVDSFANMIQSFIWFVPLIGYETPFGVVLLGISFYLFESFCREPLGRWIGRHYNAEVESEHTARTSTQDE